MNPGFWRGKRVFLTGHTGFKGSWLSLWLQSLGAEVTGYALPAPTVPSLFEIAKVETGMRSIMGDVRDLAALAAAMKTSSPEIVIHMAAQPLVRLSYASPVETYQINVMGTVNLLEAVRSAPTVRAVVNVTTDKCYENREWVWSYRENEPMGGHDPYSSSKGCAELVTAAYRNSFFSEQRFHEHQVGIATARAGNVIGGGDWALDRLIPDIIRAFSEGAPVVIRNPHATRPWQHVLEPLSGYMQLAEKLFTDGPEFGTGWNFGPRLEDSRPVEWIVKALAQKWSNDAVWHVESDSSSHEANFLKLDISKAGHELDWHPKMRLDRALGLTVDWARAMMAGADMRSVTLKQISTYQELG